MEPVCAAVREAVILELIFSTSRAGAETFSWPKPFAVLSITDPGSPPALLRQPNLVARCNLEFWDLGYAPGDGRIVFDAAMARRALEFVLHECETAKLLLVHCEAGISRSTGLAIALGLITRVDVSHQHALFISPNRLVERLVVAEAERL